MNDVAWRSDLISRFFIPPVPIQTSIDVQTTPLLKTNLVVWLTPPIARRLNQPSPLSSISSINAYFLPTGIAQLRSAVPSKIKL